MLGKLKKRKRLRVHGFLSRKSTVDGKKVLQARRRKGRHSLAVSYPNRFKNVRGKSKHHNIAGGTARVVTLQGTTERFRPSILN
ncbi:MAG: 50S ribosomal protein L34 [Candidatus Altimarinota bacterium]|jgi:ribosomal protein L34|nr:50S ribosomal protein L34 [Candidatus Gracilibacteria bacterium]